MDNVVFKIFAYLYYCHKVKHIFKRSWFSKYWKIIWVLGFIRHVHLYLGYKLWISLISFIHYCPCNRKLTTQYCPGVDMQEWISFAAESWNSLKTCMLDKSTKKKENTMCKIAIRNPGMKQDGIARVFNVSQSVVSIPLKEHRESGSIRKRKQFTLIL